MSYRDSADPNSVLRQSLLKAIEDAEVHLVNLRTGVAMATYSDERRQRIEALKDGFRHKEALLEQLRKAGL